MAGHRGDTRPRELIDVTTSKAAAHANPTASPHVLRKRDARIARMLQAAALTFAELGYEQANLEQIAARLGMRGPSLYYYFSSKDALLTACLDHTAGEVTGRARTLAAGPGSARERLRRLFADQVLVQTRDFPEFVPLFVELRVPNPKVRAHITELRRAHGDVYRAVLDEAVAAGELAAEDGHRALLLAFGALSYVQQWYDQQGRLDAQRLADELADHALRLFRWATPADRASRSATPPPV